MKIINAREAEKTLHLLLEETANSHEPIQIVGGKGNGVLISEEDWRAVQETLYLLSVPGLRESIRDGLATPVDQCHKELPW